MNAQELVDKVTDCILDDASILQEQTKRLINFRHAGMKGEGFVLQLTDGSEFQVTVTPFKR